MAYGSLALREYGDLDILIPRKHVRKAKELFFSRGYRLALLPLSKGKQTGRRFSSRKDLILDSGDGLVRVELHWRLTGRHFSFALNKDQLWQQLQRTSLGGVSVRTLALEDLLLYLCMHGSRHHWARLLWVCDVAELIKVHGELDWTSVLERAQRLGCQRMLGLGLLLATELLGAKLPDNVCREIQSQSLVLPLVEQVRENQFKEGESWADSIDRYHAHLAMRERVQDRLRVRLHHYRHQSYLRRAFIPNEQDRALVSLPASLSSLYYLVRPLRLIGSFAQKKVKRLLGVSTEAESPRSSTTSSA
jgi:hypothetical protein